MAESNINKKTKNGFLIKHKLGLLIIMPLAIIVFFLFREIENLNNQIYSLEKAQTTLSFLDELFKNDASHEDYENNNHHNHNDLEEFEDHDHSKTKEAWNLIGAKIPIMFEDEAEFKAFDNLYENYKLSIEEMETSKTPEESRELLKEHVDAHRALLMGIEKVHYPELIRSVDNNLRSLYQLEWLMFWAQEEGMYTKLLLSNEYLIETRKEILRELNILIQNQQLFLDRYISINANKKQIELFLNTFNKKKFQETNTFRNNILNNGIEGLEELSKDQLKLEAGMVFIEDRLSSLKGVADTLENILKVDINTTISEYKKQRNLFILLVVSGIILVTLLGVHITLRLTKNLELVLNFLNKNNNKENFDLNIKGNDELSHFAFEVKELSLERERQKEKIIKAKEEAEISKNNAIKASKAKSTFLANMSHEIRTPLNGVIGMLEVLNDTKLTTTQKDYLTTVENSSQLLLSLINDILDFSKIESGMLQINPHSTALRETIYDVASIIQPKAKEKNLTLNVEIDKQVPLRVKVDDHRLRQILMNFMSNAVKFTNSGYIDVSVKSIESTTEKAKLRFAVRDTGVGIDESRQLKIFESFAQEDDSTTKQFGGTGLGLSISSQLVDLMGSKIQLNSGKGLGSCFYFDLELEKDFQSAHKVNLNGKQLYLIGQDINMLSHINQELDIYKIKIKDQLNDLFQIPNNEEEKIIVLIEDTNSNIKDIHSEIKKIKKENKLVSVCLVRNPKSQQIDFEDDVDSIVNYPLLGERLLTAIKKCSDSSLILNSNKEKEFLANVLIVEDNLVNQKVVSLQLKKANCSFEIANNGQEAIEMFIKNHDKYDFILMDYMMPIKNGLEATIEIRKLEKENALLETPIIALTASIVNEDIKLFYKNGMNDYLQKPFKREELNKLIDKTLKLKESIEFFSEDEKEIITSNKRIMLVEDNRINQKVASLLLSKAGFEYKIAEDGQIAVDLYKSNPDNFSLILMDCMMPNKDGFEATKEIREHEKKNKLSKTPILALTASIVDDDIQKCFDSGMDAFIPKPVKKEKLLNEMSRFLKEKSYA